MAVKIEKVNKSSFITCEGNNYKVCFSSCGASIYSYSYKGHDWFFSPIDKNIFLDSNGFYGKTLGPIAGRYKYKGEVICHGGKHSISFEEFDFRYFEKGDSLRIEFNLCLNKDGVFYGNHCNYKITYEVSERGEILINYEIEAREDSYASLSLHSYFLFDVDDIRNLVAKIDADEVSILNNDLSIKKFVKVANAFDFKTPKLLKETCKEKENLTTRGHYLKGITYPIWVKGEQVKLVIDSSFPSGLIYLDSTPVGVIGTGNKKEKQFSCFVFEPEIDPENKEELLIKANTKKTNWIKLAFYNN